MKTATRNEINNDCSYLKQSIKSFSDVLGAPQVIFPTNSLTVRSRELVPPTQQRQLSQGISIEEQVNANGPVNRKYKCFKCYGISNSTRHSFTMPLCQECDGNEYINNSHPMADLFNKVLLAKIPSLEKKPEVEVSSYTIINPASECHSCSKPLSPEDAIYCESCPDYAICTKCYHRKNLDHPKTHRYIKKNSKNLGSKLKTNLPAMKKISQQLQSQDNGPIEQQRQFCSNCGASVQQCFQVCMDCQLAGNHFAICSECSHEERFTHEEGHTFNVRMSTKDSKIHKYFSSRPSNQFNIHISENNDTAPEDVNISPVPRNNNGFSESMVIMPDIQLLNESYEMHDQNQLQAPTPPKIQNQSSQSFQIQDNHFNPQHQQEEVHSATFHQKQYPETAFTTELQKDSMVRIMIQQSIDNSMEIQRNSINNSNRPMISLTDSCPLDPPLSPQKLRAKSNMISQFEVQQFQSRIIQQQPQKQSQLGFMEQGQGQNSEEENNNANNSQEEQDYLFTDYQCDICEVTPIRNKRYHCKQCQDYDICGECHQKRKEQHEHLVFQEVDGRIILKERELRINKVINDVAARQSLAARPRNNNHSNQT